MALTPDRSENPIPGFLPWVFWILAAAFYCYGFFQRFAPSVMVSELMAAYSVTAAILGNLSAFYFYAYASLQLPVGLILDRVGPRRTIGVAVAICGLGSLLFGMAESLNGAYLGRLLVGVGAAFSWVGALKVITLWFPVRRFAFMSGLTLMLGMMGGIVGQAPLAQLIALVGWRETMIGASVFALFLAIAVFAVLRDRTAAPSPSAPSAGLSLTEGLKDVLSRRQTWFTGMYGAMMTAPMLAFGGLWGVPYMMEAHDLSRPDAALSMSMILVGWAVGAPLLGWLSDHFGRRRLPMIGTATVAFASIWAIIYMPGLSLSTVYVLMFVNGVGSAGMIMCFAAAREGNKRETAGATLGFVNMSVMSTGAIFQPFIGWLLDLRWSGAMAEGARVYSLDAFQFAFFTLPICGGLAVVAALLTRETYSRQIEE